MRIIIDAMGGDNAPKAVVQGAIDAAKEFGVDIVLVGHGETILRCLNEIGLDNLPKGIEVANADDVVTMEDDPTSVMREHHGSSLVVGLKMLADGNGDAFISAGSTGALLTAATLTVKRVKGVRRAAFGPVIPTKGGSAILIDCGANVECTPEFLLQFGFMGSIYAEYVFKIKNPRVGLLNIGEEETKGNEQAKATYALLKNMHTINFCGNAEGRDVPKGNFDVVICDGFVGNVVLKFAEGLAKTILKLIKEAIKGGGILAKLGAFLLMPTLKKLGKRLDVTEYGGAPLLGVNGCCIISHGSSNAKSICSAIGVANDYVRGDVLAHIQDTLAKEDILTHDGEKK